MVVYLPKDGNLFQGRGPSSNKYDIKSYVANIRIIRTWRPYNDLVFADSVEYTTFRKKN